MEHHWWHRGVATAVCWALYSPVPLLRNTSYHLQSTCCPPTSLPSLNHCSLSLHSPPPSTLWLSTLCHSCSPFYSYYNIITLYDNINITLYANINITLHSWDYMYSALLIISQSLFISTSSSLISTILLFISSFSNSWVECCYFKCWYYSSSIPSKKHSHLIHFTF